MNLFDLYKDTPVAPPKNPTQSMTEDIWKPKQPESSIQEAIQDGKKTIPMAGETAPPNIQPTEPDYAGTLRQRKEDATKQVKEKRRNLAEYIHNNPDDTLAEAYEKKRRDSSRSYQEAEKAKNAKRNIALFADFMKVLGAGYAAHKEAKVDPNAKSSVSENEAYYRPLMDRYKENAEKYDDLAMAERAKSEKDKKNRNYNLFMNEYNQALANEKEAMKAEEAYRYNQQKRKEDMEDAKEKEKFKYENPAYLAEKEKERKHQENLTRIRSYGRGNSPEKNTDKVKDGSSYYLARPGGNHAKAGSIYMPRTAARTQAINKAVDYALKAYPKLKNGNLPYKKEDLKTDRDKIEYLQHVFDKLQETLGQREINNGKLTTFIPEYEHALYDLTEILRQGGAKFLDDEDMEIQETRYDRAKQNGLKPSNLYKEFK